MRCVVCFHLFSDYSGSPKVLKMVLEGLLDKGFQIDLVSSHGGVLDELEHFNLKRHSYRYSFSINPVVTMVRYAIVQLYTFIIAFRFLSRRNTVFYINTLLPVGPALAGRLMRKRVVYHYHENAFAKGVFYRILAWCMQKLATEIICVSAYQASFLKRKKNVSVIPNVLPKSFVERLHPNASEAFERKTILMLSSLKEYKGTHKFIELASYLPQFNFVLVINDTQSNIVDFITGNKLTVPDNIAIYPRKDDVTSFYNTASIVLNLSDKKKVVETFGLTALEGMSCGLPVIVPTEGGIAEMVEDGNNGYRINVQELDKIVEKINQILSDQELYIMLSTNALAFFKRYDEERMIKAIALML